MGPGGAIGISRGRWAAYVDCHGVSVFMPQLGTAWGRFRQIGERPGPGDASTVLSPRGGTTFLVSWFESRGGARLVWAVGGGVGKPRRKPRSDRGEERVSVAR